MLFDSHNLLVFIIQAYLLEYIVVGSKMIIILLNNNSSFDYYLDLAYQYFCRIVAYAETLLIKLM